MLVSLTDYNDRGVPGDIYAADNPWWAAIVLPAPWYRPGVQRFDFVQEFGRPRLVNAPNYEVNYKPWVRRIVESAQDSPALMGWQLGNELKARASRINNINTDQAFGWYLAFTRDMVDTIRAADRNHLIFMGAQYLAEATDWPTAPAIRMPRRPSHRIKRRCGNIRSWRSAWSTTAARPAGMSGASPTTTSTPTRSTTRACLRGRTWRPSSPSSV